MILLLTFCAFFVSCQSNESPVPVDTVFLEGEQVNEDLVYETPKRELLDTDFQPLLNGSYRIQLGDALEVMVEEHPDTLVANLPLSPSGNLYYLACAPFNVVGMTIDEVKEKLEKKLSSDFVEPSVFVDVVARINNRYSILGKVKSPGRFRLQVPTTLKEAISISGGLRSDYYRGEKATLVDFKNSYLLRKDKKVKVDFYELMHGDTKANNIYIRPGDTLYIASSKVEEVYVLGEVLNPRAYFYNDRLTVLNVLSTVSYSQNATKANIAILRDRLSPQPEVIEIDIDSILEGTASDVFLKPGDIIFVPEKPYRFLQDLLKSALRAFVSTFSSSAGRYITTEEVYKDDP
ncbi:MAG: polysaccharide biosynthesis/export family protein [Lentisphaeraceae bacterium]|nr:polysaccharide biosynthesis/export family protein [Lentisphaeraceae bacterium]